MAPCFGKFCLLQCFIIKVITAQMSSPLPKYIQMGPTGPMHPSNPSISVSYTNPSISSLLNSYPSLNLPALQNMPNLQSLLAASSFTNLPNFSNLPNFPNQPQMALPMMPSITVGSGSLPMVPPHIPGPINSLAPFPMSSVSNLQSPCLKSSFDPTVLNNLAIALHLLILSNLMNAPELGTESNTTPSFPAEPKTSPSASTPIPATYAPQSSPQQATAYVTQQATTYVPQQASTQISGYYATEVPDQPNYTQQNPSHTPPNSKFLGSSGFADTAPPSMMGLPSFGPGNVPNANPRNGYGLMSPYEALAPSSCPGYHGKDVFAQYGPQNLMSDFQSPYQSIAANDNISKDLFSIF